MIIRQLGFCLGLFVLGCQSLVTLETSELSESAEHFWDLGQQAMRQGEPDKAITFYQRSLVADPNLVRNHLSLAAAYLEMGDDAAASTHLGQYVNANPDQLVMRVHLADLLLRLEHITEARAEYERCVAAAQDHEQPGAGQLVHCHTKLMELAEANEDVYAEHLHRGIGLYLLARQRAALPDPEEELPPQALLCKAAGELTLAHLERPDEARPSWYLHEVWSRLAQRQPALRSLRAATSAAPFTFLTSAEKRSLQLACQCQTIEKPVK